MYICMYLPYVALRRPTWPYVALRGSRDLSLIDTPARQPTSPTHQPTSPPAQPTSPPAHRPTGPPDTAKVTGVTGPMPPVIGSLGSLGPVPLELSLIIC